MDAKYLKAPNPFFFKILSEKNKFPKMLNHLSQVGALRWVAYKNFPCYFFFFFNNCCTWFIKIIDQWRYCVRAWYHISWSLRLCIDNYRRCNKIKSNRSDDVIIQLSTELFLNYRYYNAYRKVLLSKDAVADYANSREWFFRSVIAKNYIKILDNVSTPKVLNKI